MSCQHTPRDNMRCAARLTDDDDDDEQHEATRETGSLFLSPSQRRHSIDAPRHTTPQDVITITGSVKLPWLTLTHDPVPELQLPNPVSCSDTGVPARASRSASRGTSSMPCCSAAAPHLLERGKKSKTNISAAQPSPHRDPWGSPSRMAVGGSTVGGFVGSQVPRVLPGCRH